MNMVLKGQILILRRNDCTANGVEANSIYFLDVRWIMLSFPGIFIRNMSQYLLLRKQLSRHKKMDHAICNSLLSIKAYSIYCLICTPLAASYKYKDDNQCNLLKVLQVVWSIKIYKTSACKFTIYYSQEMDVWTS